MPLLNLVAICGLPHVVVGHYALHRLPGELGEKKKRVIMYLL